MKATAAQFIITVLAVVVLTAATAVASRMAERYQAAALANLQAVPAAFDPGYRTLMDNLIVGTGR